MSDRRRARLLRVFGGTGRRQGRAGVNSEAVLHLSGRLCTADDRQPEQTANGTVRAVHGFVLMIMSGCTGLRMRPMGVVAMRVSCCVFFMMRAIVGPARTALRFGGNLCADHGLGGFGGQGRQLLRTVHRVHNMRPQQQQPGHPGQRRGSLVLAMTQAHAIAKNTFQECSLEDNQLGSQLQSTGPANHNADWKSELSMTIEPEDFAELLLRERPLLDVRAPVEFAKGAFPAARNLPLLDDDQRHQVGLRYAEAGEEAAIALGLELATPETYRSRIECWAAFIAQHPDGALYCFRGGLRSRTTQDWLRAEGIDYPLVRGGYKALRRFLLDRMYSLIDEGRILTLSGPTGSGKTELIHAWPHSVDLEGLARHKGSAFGREFTPQPSQIDWEHALTIDWMRLRRRSAAPVLVEDESRLIGRIHLPPELQALLQSAPEVRLQASMQERIERLREDYVIPIVNHYRQTSREDGWPQVEAHIADNLHRIRRRLGGARHQALISALPDAITALRDAGDWTGFDAIIHALLHDYYDPMYQYQMSKQPRPLAFSGTQDEILAWLAEGDGVLAS